MAFAPKKASTPATQPLKISDFFKPSVELEHPKGITLGVYGVAKAGKTHFALSAPGKKYIIDTESALALNIQNVSQEVRDETFVLDALKFVPGSHRTIDYDASIFNTFDITEQLIDQIIADEEHCTIIVDSVTDIWEWLSNWLYDVAGKKSDKDSTKLKMQTEWGKANGPYLEFMKMLKNAPCDVILTAKAVPAYDGAQQLDYNIPKWQNKTPYWVEVFGELRYNGLQRTFSFDGSRIGELTGVIESPTFPLVKDYITDKTGVKFE